MDTFDGFILAGGASSRMGTNKAKLRLDGKTFVERITSALRGVTNTVTIVGGGVEKTALEAFAEGSELASTVQTVPDVFAAWGALGGVHAALAASKADWAIVVACD